MDKDNPLELEQERDTSQRLHISFIEGFLLIAFALSADALELLTLIPYVGWLLAIFVVPYGYFVSGILVLWSVLRGTTGRMEVSITVRSVWGRKIILMALGTLADGVLGSIPPIRTITTILVITLNNRVEKKNLKKIEGYLKRFGL